MQNRFVGDIGDYGKYGLLRHLEDTGLRLGINWYLTPNESATNDGQHIGYLIETTESLYRCDPELFAILADLVARGRRDVSEIRDVGLFRPETVFYERSLSYLPGTTMKERSAIREPWFEGAEEALSRCELLFVDPDNGLESQTSRLALRGPKYVYFDDLRPAAVRGQSLLIYHHFDRSGKETDQAIRRTEQLRQELGVKQVLALKWERVSPRFYFLAAAPPHQDVLVGAVDDFLRGPWGRHFKQMI